MIDARRTWNDFSWKVPSMLQTQGHDRRNALATLLLTLSLTHTPTRQTINSRHAAARLAAEQHTYRFPDGSMYRGGVESGMQHGDGEWHSGQGDVYIGQFAKGVYEGKGRYTDARGNVYDGGFQGGAFHGLGTYMFADGRAEISAYDRGREVGEGVRWSQDRIYAWRLRDGEVVEEIDLSEAAAIASTCGLAMPAGVFELLANVRTRLLQHINDSSEETLFAYDGYIQVPEQGSLMGSGALVAHSKQPLVDSDTCDKIVSEVEAHASARGGWSTKRHESYPTTDMPVQQLPETLRWLRESLLPDVAWPFIAHSFDFALNKAGGSDDARASIRVAEAFVVKYNASAGQRELRPHRDGAFVSFNIALNNLDEYEGGGTYFRKLDDKSVRESATLRSPKGHMIAHSSALMHGGHPITSGVRYLLVAFCTIEPAYRTWAGQFYEHVQDVIDPETDD